LYKEGLTRRLLGDQGMPPKPREFMAPGKMGQLADLNARDRAAIEAQPNSTQPFINQIDQGAPSTNVIDKTGTAPPPAEAAPPPDQHSAYDALIG
jgi:hypothetical protein